MSHLYAQAIGHAFKESKNMHKVGVGKSPVVAFVAGRTIPAGRSIGHAGAMVVGGRGTHKGKVEALTAAGVRIAETIDQIPDLLRRNHGR